MTDSVRLESLALPSFALILVSLCSLTTGLVTTSPPTLAVCSGTVPPAPAAHSSVYVFTEMAGVAVATYTCSTGYWITGKTIAKDSLVCLGSSWSSLQAPTCSAVKCGVPSTGNHSTFSGSNFTYQSSVNYTCNLGYHISGMTPSNTMVTSTCLVNGSWSRTAPSCQIVDCGTPSTGTQATFSGSLYTYQSSVVYTCNIGYHISGLTASDTTVRSTCLASGLWNQTAPSCQIVDCGNPSTGTQATFSGSLYTYKSSVVYTCNLGYYISGLTASDTTVRSTCLASGLWNQTAPSCQIVDCGNPSTGTQATFSGSLYTYKSSIVYTCNLGYHISGLTASDTTVRSTCLASGLWNQTAPSCQIVNCGTPSTGTQATFSGSLYTYKSSIVYTCNLGYHISGLTASDTTVRSTCLASGLWNQTAPSCQIVDCGNPSTGTQATFSGSLYTYKSSVVYTCNLGYHISGLTASDTTVRSTCLASGLWNQTAPSCQIVDCSNPSTGTQATFSGSLYTYKSSIVYTCNLGYYISGLTASDTTVRSTCLASGLWNQTAPSCQIVDCGTPSTGTQATFSGSLYTYQSSVVYTCNLGYHISGLTASDTAVTSTCLASGLWSQTAPSCQVVTCGLITGLANGTFNTTGYDYGQMAFYTCNTGYYISGMSQRLATINASCQANGMWTIMPKRCIRKYCTRMLTAPLNGGLSPNPVLNRYSDVVSYTCNIGYFVRGSAVDVSVVNATCQGNQVWSARQPACDQIKCPSSLRTSLPYGTVKTPTAYVYTSIVNYTCISGFNITGTGQTAVAVSCQLNGTWSGPAPTCSPVNCGVPGGTRLVTNGTLSGINYTFTAAVVYTCNLGYHITGKGDSVTTKTLTCSKSGTWSSKVPTCSRVTCPTLPSISFGKVTFTNSYSYMSIATFKCTTGYHIQGLKASVTTLTSACQANRTWTVQSPTCSKVTCPPLSTSVINGYTTPSQSTYNLYGGSLTYTCDSGYYITSSSSSKTQVKVLMCQLDGTWNTQVPTCSPVDCSNPGTTISNGVSTGRLYTYSQAVTYTCNTGFHISTKGPTVTTVTIECQSNGVWNATKPSCSVITCPSLPTTIINGTVTGTSYTYSNTVTFQCAPGTAVTGASVTVTSRVLQCTLRGSWDRYVPTCSVVIKYCPTLRGASPGPKSIALSNSLALGSVATYTCSSGYKISSTAKRTCLQNKTWSGAEPSCQNINECSLGSHTCNQVNGYCTDTSGSYQCSCNKGYSGNGRTCTAVCRDPCISGQGLCIAPDVCNCSRGYSGWTCQNLWPDVSYVGAFTAPSVTRETVVSNMFLPSDGDYHPGRCALACFQASFIYAAMVKGTQCRCGSDKTSFVAASMSTLTPACQGAGRFQCGSNSTASVYQLLPVPPTNASIVPSGNGTLAERGQLYTLLGDTLKIACRIDTPSVPLSYSWWVNGTISQIHHNRTLTISQSSKADIGMYRCSAVNMLVPIQSPNFTLPTNATASATITIQEPPKAYVVNTSLILLQGSQLRVACLATGDPGTDFMWQLSTAQGLQDTSGNANVPNNILQIDQVQFHDQGRYVCTAYNSMIADRNVQTSVAYVNITVWVPPTITATTTSEIRYYRHSINLEVKLQHPVNPVPTRNDVQWFRSSSESQALVPVSDGNSNAYVLSVQFLDAVGIFTYTCTVMTAAGTTNANTQLTVYAVAIPQLNATEDRQTVMVGENATFSIFFDSPVFPVPSMNDIVWTDADGLLMSLRPTVTISPDHRTLKVHRARPNDRGAIICTVATLAGKRNLTTALVVVVPTVVSQARQFSLTDPQQVDNYALGMDVTLQIDFKLPPFPYPLVTWKFRSTTIINSSTTLLFEHPERAILQLSEVQVEQSGIYQAFVHTSNATSPVSSYTFNVTVVAPSSPDASESAPSVAVIAGGAGGGVVLLLVVLAIVIIAIKRFDFGKSKYAIRNQSHVNAGFGSTDVALENLTTGSNGLDSGQYDTLSHATGQRRPDYKETKACSTGYEVVDGGTDDNLYDRLGGTEKKTYPRQYAHLDNTPPVKVGCDSTAAEYDVLHKVRPTVASTNTVDRTMADSDPEYDRLGVSYTQAGADCEYSVPVGLTQSSLPSDSIIGYTNTDVLSTTQQKASLLMAELDANAEISATKKPTGRQASKRQPYAELATTRDRAPAVKEVERPLLQRGDYCYSDVHIEEGKVSRSASNSLPESEPTRDGERDASRLTSPAQSSVFQKTPEGDDAYDCGDMGNVIPVPMKGEYYDAEEYIQKSDRNLVTSSPKKQAAVGAHLQPDPSSYQVPASSTPAAENDNTSAKPAIKTRRAKGRPTSTLSTTIDDSIKLTINPAYQPAVLNEIPDSALQRPNDDPK